LPTAVQARADEHDTAFRNVSESLVWVTGLGVCCTAHLMLAPAGDAPRITTAAPDAPASAPATCLSNIPGPPD
jgi:hypothetical protein